VGPEAGSARLGRRWPAHSCRERERRAAVGARSRGGEGRGGDRGSCWKDEKDKEEREDRRERK